MNGFLYVLLTKSVRKVVLTSCGYDNCKVKDVEETKPILNRAMAGVSVNGQPATCKWNEDRHFPQDDETTDVITPVPFTQSYQSPY